MVRFLAFRLLQTIPVLLGVSFLVFLSLYLLPGDVTQQLLGLAASEDSIRSLREELGLDQPFIVQYGIWLGNVLSGDFGSSHVMRTEVLGVLIDKTANSMILMGSSLLLVVIGAFILGTVSAAMRDRPIDRAVSIAMYVLASMPTYWFGLILIIAFSLHWPILPSSGMRDYIDPGGLGDLLAHLVLPTIATAATSLAIVTRVTRGAMVDALNAPHITAARSRGLGRGSVVYRHAFRNAAPTFANICGLQIGYLFGSAIFSEIIFDWPGIGLQLYNSIIGRDGPVVQGCVLVIAVVFVGGNLIADTIIRWLEVSGDE